MKILLLMPDAGMHKIRTGLRVRSLREAPLTLITLAALVPDEDIEWEVVDCSIDRIPMDEPADLVGISVITGNAVRAYALADHFRRRGIPVVLGGVHVSVLPDEALAHADSVVIGMAEQAWPSLVSDFRRGRMQRIYRGELPEGEWLTGVPTPRRDLLRRSGYVMPDSAQATRGCRRGCDFCSTPVTCPRYLKRPVADVVADVRSIRGRRFCFNDVNLTDDPDYAMELFEALAPLGKKWGGLATVDVADHPDLLEVMRRSGCVYLLLGFESISAPNLFGIRKNFNKAWEYARVMRVLHEYGMTVQGCFVFGLDEDGPMVFADTVGQVLELRIDIPRYSIYTPYPGTPLFKRLLAERRILSFNWEDYDTMHVVIRPKRMTPETLYSGFKFAYRETFRYRRVWKRVKGCGLASAVSAIGNLTYRSFVKRLYTEARFARPYSVPDRRMPSGDLFRAEALTVSTTV